MMDTLLKYCPNVPKCHKTVGFLIMPTYPKHSLRAPSDHPRAPKDPQGAQKDPPEVKIVTMSRFLRWERFVVMAILFVTICV